MMRENAAAGIDLHQYGPGWLDGPGWLVCDLRREIPAE